MDERSPAVLSKNFRVTRFESIVESIVAAFLTNFGSKATAVEYARTTQEFLAFVAPHISGLAELRRDHIIFYKKSLTQRGLAHKTILKKLSTISSLCKFLAHEGLVERDLTYGLKRPKSYNKKETAALTEEDVRRVFASMNPGAYAFQAHRALLAVGFYTGLRSAEIRNLKVGDLTAAEGHRIIKTKIKGDKPHEVPLNPFVVHCLNEHLAKLNDLGFKVTAEHYLFPRLRPRDNRPISDKALRQILRSKLQQAGSLPQLGAEVLAA